VVSEEVCHNLSVLIFAKTIGVAMYQAAVKAQCRGVFATLLALLSSACVVHPIAVVGGAESPQVIEESPVAIGYPVQIYALDERGESLGDVTTEAAETMESSVVISHAAEVTRSPDGLPAPVRSSARAPQLDSVESAKICEVQQPPAIYYFENAAPSLSPVFVSPASAPLKSDNAAEQMPKAQLPVRSTAAIERTSVASFTIGVGDTVEIEVLGRPELTARGSVSDDGQVICSLIGPVKIAGLTPLQASERIAEGYRTGQYLVSPQVTVTITDYQSQLLTVLGEVGRPGRFPVRTRLSVLDALALSGGITELGASTAYLLRTAGDQVTRHEIDLDVLIQTGAGQQHFEMFAGDTLLVPKADVFYIYGEVRNPNAYKIKPGITVIQALSLAGGLTDKGTDRRIDIHRKDASGHLRTLAASLNEPLRPDDVIYIRERWF